MYRIHLRLRRNRTSSGEYSPIDRRSNGRISWNPTASLSRGEYRPPSSSGDRRLPIRIRKASSPLLSIQQIHRTRTTNRCRMALSQIPFPRDRAHHRKPTNNRKPVPPRNLGHPRSHNIGSLVENFPAADSIRTCRHRHSSRKNRISLFTLRSPIQSSRNRSVAHLIRQASRHRLTPRFPERLATRTIFDAPLRNRFQNLRRRLPPPNTDRIRKHTTSP